MPRAPGSAAGANSVRLGANRPLSKREQRKLAKSQAKAVRRARRVQRIVRHVDAWSVLKFSLLFYLCLLIVVLVAGVLLWNLASTVGTVDDIEKLVVELGLFESFEFEPGKILRASVLGGLILVIVGAGFNVLVVAMFNLISDLVGGIRITVIEVESARVAPAPTTPATAPSSAGAEPVAPTTSAAESSPASGVRHVGSSS